MTLEVFVYVAGAALIPAIGWAIHLTWQTKKTVYLLTKLLEIHEGSGGLKSVIEENTRAVKALTHYVIWLSKQQGQGSPPPPVESNDA